MIRDLLILTSIRGVGSIRARHLIEALGSATAVLQADASELAAAGAVGQFIIEGRNDKCLAEKADRELEFIAEHHITPLVYGQPGYPQRLLECPDAPALLFTLGHAPLDAPHIVSVVGTRQSTQYGRDMVEAFVSELHEAVPDVVVVSGMAYGIDVTAHRASLGCHATTVACMAHGLDRIYPYQHRDVARQLLAEGGSIVTEYISGTEPERGNFLARNRIIAGLADAVLVAESKDRGGSLVTASIALDYNRDVFAFPGRVGDSRSEGCNRLIRLNRAALITSAQDFIEAVNWQPTAASQTSAVQHTINFEEDHLTQHDRLILDALRDRGDLRLAQLADLTGIDHTILAEQLLALELSGRIRILPGGVYQHR